MQTVSDILDAIGHKAFAQAIGVTLSNVTHMRKNGRFPSKKYILIKALCAERGLPEPAPALFAFDDAASPEAAE